MTLTTDYQYIGRSNGVLNVGGSYLYYLLVYAKAQPGPGGSYSLWLKTRLACLGGGSFYGHSTAAYAAADGQEIFRWEAGNLPEAAWQQGLTENGVTYTGWTELQEGSVTVECGFGQDKTLDVEASFRRLDQQQPAVYLPLAVTMQFYGQVVLPAICGASEPKVSASEVALGQAVTILTGSRDASLTHTLRYSFGQAQGLVAEGVKEQYRWTPPLYLARQIPETTAAEATITCETFSGSQSLGSREVRLRLYLQEDAESRPLLIMSEPYSSPALPQAFQGLFLQNISQAHCDMQVSGKWGARPVDVQVLLNGKPGIKQVLTQVGENTITGRVVDSRGFETTLTHTIQVLPYQKPSLLPASGRSEVVCARCDAQGVLTPSGNCLRIIASRSYSPVTVEGDQKNFCAIRYRVDGGSWEEILGRHTQGDQVDTGAIPGLTLDPMERYRLELEAVDDLGYGATLTLVIPSDKVTMHLKEGGDGVALGGYCQSPGFHCYMDACFLGSTQPLQDYVVEQGVEGQWYYRKWAGGTAECWGFHVIAEAVSLGDAWGPLYCSPGFSFSYPQDLFTASPAYVTLEPAATNGKDLWLARKGVGTAQRTDTVFFVSATSQLSLPEGSAAISVRAMGRWK